MSRPETKKLDIVISTDAKTVRNAVLSTTGKSLSDEEIEKIFFSRKETIGFAGIVDTSKTKDQKGQVDVLFEDIIMLMYKLDGILNQREKRKK